MLLVVGGSPAFPLSTAVESSSNTECLSVLSEVWLGGVVNERCKKASLEREINGITYVR